MVAITETVKVRSALLFPSMLEDRVWWKGEALRNKFLLKTETLIPQCFAPTPLSFVPFFPSAITRKRDDNEADRLPLSSLFSS